MALPYICTDTRDFVPKFLSQSPLRVLCRNIQHPKVNGRCNYKMPCNTENDVQDSRAHARQYQLGIPRIPTLLSKLFSTVSEYRSITAEERETNNHDQNEKTDSPSQATCLQLWSLNFEVVQSNSKRPLA